MYQREKVSGVCLHSENDKVVLSEEYEYGCCCWESLSDSGEKYEGLLFVETEDLQEEIKLKHGGSLPDMSEDDLYFVLEDILGEVTAIDREYFNIKWNGRYGCIMYDFIKTI